MAETLTAKEQQTKRDNKMTALINLLMATATCTEEEIEAKYGRNADQIHDILDWESANDEDVPAYSVETFAQHLEASLDNDAYMPHIESVSANPMMGAAYNFLLIGGPGGVYQLLEMMNAGGVIDKKRVRETAKITATRTAIKEAWFKTIYKEIAPRMWEAANEYFIDNLSDYRNRFPEIDSLEIGSFLQVLEVSGKTTLNTKVDSMTVEQTDTECAVALGFRLDAHSPKRNGGWDPKAKAYTKEWTDKKAKEEAAAEVAADAATE